VNRGTDDFDAGPVRDFPACGAAAGAGVGRRLGLVPGESDASGGANVGPNSGTGSSRGVVGDTGFEGTGPAASASNRTNEAIDRAISGRS
jgi:hypothetical protein